MKIKFRLLITQNAILSAYNGNANPVELAMSQMPEFKDSGMKIRVSKDLIEITGKKGQSQIYQMSKELEDWLDRFKKENVRVGHFNEVVSLKYLASIITPGT